MSDLIAENHGRWCVAGVNLPVVFVRYSQAHPESAWTDYPLSAKEIAACLAFGFPPIHEQAINETDPDDLTIVCRCGETIYHIDHEVWVCDSCHRRYRVAVQIEEVTT